MLRTRSNMTLTNLMWTFIVLNLHQLTDSKAQLNETNVNKSNNLTGSLDTGDREAMVERLLQTGKL